MDSTTRTTIIEWDADSALWFLMDDNGNVNTFTEPSTALASIKRTAKRIANKTGMVVDKIEWRNVPQGFEVPR